MFFDVKFCFMLDGLIGLSEYTCRLTDLSDLGDERKDKELINPCL